MKISFGVLSVFAAGAYVPAADRFYPEGSCSPEDGGSVSDIVISCIAAENEAGNAFTYLHTNLTDAAANPAMKCADDDTRVWAYGPYENYIVSQEGLDVVYPMAPYSVLIANIDVNNLAEKVAEDSDTAPCEITVWIVAKGVDCPVASDTATQFKYTTLKDVDDGEKDTETWQYTITDGPLVAENGDQYLWYADISNCVAGEVAPNAYFRQALVGLAGAGDESGAQAGFLAAPLLAAGAVAILYL